MDLAKKNIYYIMIAVFAALLVALLLTARIEARSRRSAEPQDPTGLDRRLSLLEQRFYVLENTVNRIEQQTRLSPSTEAPSGGRDTQSELLRAQVEALQRQMADLACGLVRLDERTLSSTARAARERSGAINVDPCRERADAPLRLATRP